MRFRGHRPAAFVATFIATTSLASCHRTTASSNDTTVALANSAQPALPAVLPSSAPTPAGPDMLSTVGTYTGGPPLTRIAARQGTFAIQSIAGVDTLTLNGVATSYKQEGADAPEPVAANNAISMVGVFELPQESVAWVIIDGGTACPSLHVLVGARSGLALPGQGILGCDDSGTMRREGDKITFEAGGSSGTYKDGVITTTTKPTGWGPPVSGSASAAPAR